jgi:hypothetical protein
MQIGCRFSAKVSVVDERTALENQILGQYQELDHNLQLLASVRDDIQADTASQPPRFSTIRAKAIHARQTQLFNRDDIDELKQMGCLGETNQATLAIRPCPEESDPAISGRLKRLIDSENEARKTIILFIVTTSPDLTKKDLGAVSRVYAQITREQAQPGSWIQLADGQWQKK